MSVKPKTNDMENVQVAYCGLYCGACRSLKKGKCPGCEGNEKASWCEIRKCCRQNGYATCADCTLIPLGDCKKYNNFIARVIGFLTRTDRSKCIDCIKEMGVEAFAREMDAKGQMSIKK